MLSSSLDLWANRRDVPYTAAALPDDINAVSKRCHLVTPTDQATRLARLLQRRGGINDPFLVSLLF